MLCQVRYINKDYCQYIDRLYSCSNESIKDLRDDEEVVLNQYDYLLDAYTNQYGCSHEDDFADNYFAGIDLFNWSGHILAVKLLPATMIKDTLIAFKSLPVLISKVNSPCQGSETESTGKVFLINVEEHTSKSSQPATADLTTTLYHYSSIISSISSWIVSSLMIDVG